MRSFDDIRLLAEAHKGKEFISEHLIDPKNLAEISEIEDDRWLSALTKCIFQAGFNWKIIENKWPAFEDGFFGFDLHRCAMMSDDDIDQLMSEKKVVANYVKIKAVRENAQYLLSLADEYGSVGSCFSGWKSQDYGRNVLEMRKAGSRLGGNTGLIFLRRMGVDAFIFSDDVVKALAREDIIDKAPTSKKAMDTVQQALDQWQDESGLALNHLSQILAWSVD